MAHGGRRPNAGRKTNEAKMQERKDAILQLSSWFTPTLQKSKWVTLLDDEDSQVVLKAMCYLSDRAYGKAPQAVEHSGPNGDELKLTIVHVGRA